MAITTSGPRSQTMHPHARSAAVVAVVQQQLARLAEQVPEPKLAGPLQHFAAAAAWGAQNLRAPERADDSRPVIDGLCEHARALLSESGTTSQQPGAHDDVATTLQLLGDATERNVSGAGDLLGELLRTLKLAEEGPLDGSTSSPVESPPTVDVERMTAYLRERFGADAAAHGVEYVTGGFSKHTILVSATFEDERQDIVLRQVPKGRHAEDLPFEFDVLANVWRPELPIPEPLWIESSHNPLGGPFFASRRAGGTNLGDVFGASAEIPEQVWLDLADFLAHLHTTGPLEIRNAPVPPMRTPEEIRAAIDEMAAKADSATGIGPRLAAVLGWLRAHVPEAGGPPAIVHGDVGLHNALVEGGRLTAVLDWERSHFGDPVEDLAYLQPSLEPVYSWPAFLDRYVEAGGSRPDPAAERFYTVWQDTWRHIECLVLGEDFFDTRGVPMMIAGFVFAPRFLASAVETAFEGVR